MSREVHVRFWEGLGLKCPGLLTKEPETWDIATYHKLLASGTTRFADKAGRNRLMLYPWHGVTDFPMFTIKAEYTPG